MIKIIEIKSNNHKIKLYTNGVVNPKKIVLCLHGFNGDLWGDGFDRLRGSFDNILVCSFDSAGHGESEIKSIDMTMKDVVCEITDVINYLNKTYSCTPVFLFALSYGGYRAMVALAQNDYKNIKGIIFVNPAFRMLQCLEKLKEFDYNTLPSNALVPMKLKLNKFLSKSFLDDLYNNDIYSMHVEIKVPIYLLIGENDDLIPRSDLMEFASIYDCTIMYLDDGHCLKNENSWVKIRDLITCI